MRFVAALVVAAGAAAAEAAAAALVGRFEAAAAGFFFSSSGAAPASSASAAGSEGDGGAFAVAAAATARVGRFFAPSCSSSRVASLSFAVVVAASAGSAAASAAGAEGAAGAVTAGGAAGAAAASEEEGGAAAAEGRLGPASLGGGKEKGQSDQHETYATDALKNFLIECINDLARRFLGVGPELTMTATGGGSDDDDMTRAQADQIDVNAGIRTRNEVRAERGIPLMDEPEADQLGITIGTGVSFLAGQLANQQAAAQAAAQPKAGPSAPGTQPPGDEAGPSDADGPPRPGRPSGDAGAEGDRSAQAQSEAASTGDRPPVTAKDDQRQPDTEATKEIGAFLRFAKAKADRGAWRDFEFQHIDEATGRVLNHLGSTGDTAAIRHALAKADGNAQALIDWYESGADGQIEWGSEGDFDACVAIAGKYIDDPEGFCQLRHMGATGEPAGKAPGEGTKAAADSFTPPKGVQEEAQRAVEWIKDGHAGANFTAVGRGRAGDLAAGRAVSLDVVKRMASYLARHKVDEQGQGWSPGEDGYPSPGRVAWAAWGGDPAVSWTSSILASAEKAAGDVAFISPSGQVVMPEPLKTGDKIIVQHADATNDAYPVIDASTPNDDAVDQQVAKATELMLDMLEPELTRLRASYVALATLRND